MQCCVVLRARAVVCVLHAVCCVVLCVLACAVLLAALGDEGPKVQRFAAQEVAQNLEFGVHVRRTLNSFALYDDWLGNELGRSLKMINVHTVARRFALQKILADFSALQKVQADVLASQKILADVFALQRVQADVFASQKILADAQKKNFALLLSTTQQL